MFLKETKKSMFLKKIIKTTVLEIKEGLKMKVDEIRTKVRKD